MIKPISRQIIPYLSISCALFLFFSCGKSTDTIQDHLVFRYNEYANINTLDPAFSRTLQDNGVCNQLFNGLVQLDDELNILPCIAKNWTISNDGTRYQFNLRDDVYFHKHELFGKDSTRTVVANDFEYSLNRLRDEKIAAPGGWVLNKVTDFKAINDTLFEIKYDTIWTTISNEHLDVGDTVYIKNQEEMDAFKETLEANEYEE